MRDTEHFSVDPDKRPSRNSAVRLTATRNVPASNIRDGRPRRDESITECTRRRRKCIFIKIGFPLPTPPDREYAATRTREHDVPAAAAAARINTAERPPTVSVWWSPFTLRARGVCDGIGLCCRSAARPRARVEQPKRISAVLINRHVSTTPAADPSVRCYPYDVYTAARVVSSSSSSWSWSPTRNAVAVSRRASDPAALFILKFFG